MKCYRNCLKAFVLIGLASQAFAQAPPPWWLDYEYPPERRIDDAIGIAVDSFQFTVEPGSGWSQGLRRLSTLNTVRTEATRIYDGWADYQAGNGWGVVEHGALGVMHSGITALLRNGPGSGYVHALADHAVYGLADMLTAAGVGEYFAGVDIDELRNMADLSVADAKESAALSQWNTAELRKQKEVERQANRFGEPWEREFWKLKNEQLGADWAFFPDKRSEVWSEFAQLQGNPSLRPATLGSGVGRSREAGAGLSGAVDLTAVRVSGAEPIRFRIFDHGREDGDRVNIYLTSPILGIQTLAEDITMSNAGQVFEIPLSCEAAAEGGRISIQIVARNTGSLHPNTGGIEILSVDSIEDDAPTLQKYALESAGDSGSLRFFVTPTGHFCGATGAEVVADLIEREILRDAIFLGLDPRVVAEVAAMARAELIELGIDFAGSLAVNRVAATAERYGLLKVARLVRAGGAPWSVVSGVLVPSNAGADTHLVFRMENDGNLHRYSPTQMDAAVAHTISHAQQSREAVRQRYRDEGHLLLPEDDGWEDFIQQQTTADAAWTIQNLQWPNDLRNELRWIDQMEEYAVRDLEEVKSLTLRSDEQ